MGISAIASYIGGSLIDVVDLDASVVARCFPMAAAWPGRTTFTDLATRQLRRAEAAAAIAPAAPGREPRLPDPGFARFRADGEAHLFSPSHRQGDHGARHDRRPRGHRCRARALSHLARPRRVRSRGPARRAARPTLVDARPARRGRGRPLDRAPVRRLGDERRRPVARGAPGADHRHPARRRRRQHRRGRRGPGLVRARRGRPAPRRADQAGRLGAVRRHRGLPRPRRPARDQDRPGLQARRGRPAARSQGDRVHRRAPPRPGRPVATSARRRTTTSTRSRTSPS